MAKKKSSKRSNVAKTTSGTRVKSTKVARKKAAKRELIDTGRDKRYVRRDAEGQFHESDDVGKSLSQDRRRKAKRAAKPGQGDKGDQETSQTEVQLRTPALCDRQRSSRVQAKAGFSSLYLNPR